MENQATKIQNPVVMTVTVPWTDVQAAYDKRLDEIATEVELPGFRKGNAPRNMVEEKVGKKSIYSDVIERVVPPAYQKEATNRALKPMIAPRLKPISLEENKDWQFEISVVQKPEVSLGDYEKTLAEKLAAGKIVVPGKPEPASPSLGGQTKEEKMRIAFDTLLEKAQIELPELLVEEEVNARLTQLVDQLQAIGMTVEQYMKTKNLDTAKLRAEYDKTAREMLKLNLALDKIASDQNFTEKDRIPKAIDWLISH